MTKNAKGSHTSKKNSSPFSRLGIAALAVVLLAAAGAVLFLILTGEGEKPETAPAGPSVPVWYGEGAKQENGAPAASVPETGGNQAKISRVPDTDTPGTLTLGLAEAVDFSADADTIAANLAQAGWGRLKWSVSSDGGLLLYNPEAPVLSPEDYEKQTAWLETSGPEQQARTFLQNSGVLRRLEARGYTLDLTAIHKEGDIAFEGSDAAGMPCSIRFSFLYTGSFNQAVLTAETMENTSVTDRVISAKRASDKAHTWNGTGAEAVEALSCELRSIRGIPFWVYHCADGSTAYALAVEEEALSQVPGLAGTYAGLMELGLQEYVFVPGAGT